MTGSGPLRLSRPSVAVCALVVVLLAAAVAAAAWLSSPSASALQARVDTRLHRTSGTPVPSDKISLSLRQAVVATEDERFLRHHGIDIVGIARALPYDIAHLSFAQGASTITEQVAKVLYLGGTDHSPWRKLQDAALAVKLENRYSKSAILDAYLNSAYFGEGAYGVEAASERYFAVPARRLTLPQASLLAGLVQAPSRYDPLRHPQVARARQVDVLRSLVRTGKLGEAAATTLLARPLRLKRIILPAVTGIDLSTGPAFVWWELAVGAAIMLCGITVYVALRSSRRAVTWGMPAMRIGLLAIVLVGAVALVRSFRAA